MRLKYEGLIECNAGGKRMALPIRTTLADVEKVCGFLATKPIGASMAEARAVLDKKDLDGRKLSALKRWGLIEENGEKLRLTELGREVTREKGARRPDALRRVISDIPPYQAIIERAVHRGEYTIATNEVSAHWYEHFPDYASENERILNDQAVCFFQVAQGADLGEIVIGRRGQSTRFELNEENARKFVEGHAESSGNYIDTSLNEENDHVDDSSQKESDGLEYENSDKDKLSKSSLKHGNRVFITHGKNKKILDQVKEIVSYGKFDPVVAQETESLAKPMPDKIMDEMRGCDSAVIHVGVDGLLYDADGNETPQINGNVLIEIGAAMALYGRNFVLLVEEGVSLPSNLQGLYECRYSGDELNMTATMKLLKAFNDFK